MSSLTKKRKSTSKARAVGSPPEAELAPPRPRPHQTLRALPIRVRHRQQDQEEDARNQEEEKDENGHGVANKDNEPRSPNETWTLTRTTPNGNRTTWTLCPSITRPLVEFVSPIVQFGSGQADGATFFGLREQRFVGLKDYVNAIFEVPGLGKVENVTSEDRKKRRRRMRGI